MRCYLRIKLLVISHEKLLLRDIKLVNNSQLYNRLMENV
jgi:hypothetical protein